MKSSPPRIFFWQNMPSHHQVGSLDFLASIWGAPVTGVWCSDISEFRRKQGWTPAPRHALADIFLPAQEWQAAVEEVVDANPEAIHVFSGIGAYGPVTHALRRLAARPSARIGLIVESPVMLGWRKWVRLIKTKVNYAPYLQKIGVVFAMGSLGVDFYRRIGFAEKQLYPYLYQGEASPVSPRAIGDEVRLAYVGQFNHRKGTDILFDALLRIERTDWVLDLYGDGPERERLQRLLAASRHAGRVCFKGTVPSFRLMSELGQNDLLLVPSRFDGWGMAVNEGLQMGLSVIVSSMAGSSDLVRASAAGAVYPVDSTRTLAAEIVRRLEDRALLRKEKALAAAYAPKVSPAVAGAYLSAVLRHVFLGEGARPSPDWLEANSAPCEDP